MYLQQQQQPLLLHHYPQLKNAARIIDSRRVICLAHSKRAIVSPGLVQLQLQGCNFLCRDATSITLLLSILDVISRR